MGCFARGTSTGAFEVVIFLIDGIRGTEFNF